MEFLTSERLYNSFYRLYGILKNNSDINIPISPGQLRLLAIINEEKCITQKKIGEQFLKKASSVSTVLAKLEKEELIEKIRDEKDKRNIIIHITKKGEKLVDENYEKQKQLSKEFFDCLTLEEQENLLELLLKLHK